MDAVPPLQRRVRVAGGAGFELDPLVQSPVVGQARVQPGLEIVVRPVLVGARGLVENIEERADPVILEDAGLQVVERVAVETADVIGVDV